MLVRLFLLFSLLLTSAAIAADKVVRIGYQKNGTFSLLRARGGLDVALAPLGYSVTWAEFPGGPQLLEALNAGAIDVGETGEAPPIFAQAAGHTMTYVANEPAAPLEEAILVTKTSPIRSVADLKGKKIALNKGSNVHYLLVRALEHAGLAYSDVTPVFLAPADARAAFERGDVDAWAIWDPYFAAAQAATEARTLATGEGLVPNMEFYLAARSFANRDGKALEALIAALDDADRWAGQHKGEAAEVLSAAMHLPVPVIMTTLDRRSYGVSRLTDDIVANQQKIADTFAKLGLIPKPLNVSDAVVRLTQ